MAPEQQQQQQQQPEQTARARARADRSGKAAAKVMYGGANAEPEPQQPQKYITPNPRKDNYRNPTEFFAGPAKPGKIHGTRRNKAAQKDSVGFLLTDEGLMGRGPGGGAGAGGAGNARRGGAGGAGGAGGQHSRGAKVPLAERIHLDYSCNPTTAEPKWRSGVRVTHPQGAMDAPYFEELDPKPAREEPAATGKRRLKPPQNKQPIFINLSKPMGAEEAAAARPVSNRKTNKANESVNVLCLNTYSPKQLNEPRETHRPLGPRRWAAPEMPPKPKPHHALIKCSAKDEHDVLGTGRWGTPEEPRPQGVARGSCRPKHDSANLFAGDVRAARRRDWVPPSEVPKPTAQQRKRAGQPNLLKYYDPNTDAGTMQPAKQKPHGNRANEESKVDASEQTAYRPSRGPGMYAKNGKPSASLW